jgi:hypothetical protein
MSCMQVTVQGLILIRMIDTTIDLLLKYNITFQKNCRIFVDGFNPPVKVLNTKVSEEKFT